MTKKAVTDEPQRLDSFPKFLFFLKRLLVPFFYFV